MKRIALIHALKLSIPPIETAFAQHWPQAEIVNILDDSLSADHAKNPVFSPLMFERFNVLATYAHTCGADAILFTCSAFAPCIDAVKAKLPIPVLRPNEAMFEAAISMGAKLGLLASFPASITSMTPELHAMAQARGKSVSLATYSVPAAMLALQSGDGATHDALLADAARHFEGCDAVMLAQFSTARAQAALQAKLHCPVLTTPDTAVLRLRALLS